MHGTIIQTTWTDSHGNTYSNHHVTVTGSDVHVTVQSGSRTYGYGRAHAIQEAKWLLQSASAWAGEPSLTGEALINAQGAAIAIAHFFDIEWSVTIIPVAKKKNLRITFF